jgi:hypothetical protein
VKGVVLGLEGRREREKKRSTKERENRERARARESVCRRESKFPKVDEEKGSKDNKEMTMVMYKYFRDTQYTSPFTPCVLIGNTM